YKLQATSYKLQATSYKLQATSYKLQATLIGLGGSGKFLVLRHFYEATVGAELSVPCGYEPRTALARISLVERSGISELYGFQKRM
ncbi:MAG: hypothetical protein CL539_16570, partial [Alcanivorax sp.]